MYISISCKYVSLYNTIKWPTVFKKLMKWRHLLNVITTKLVIAITRRLQQYGRPSPKPLEEIRGHTSLSTALVRTVVCDCLTNNRINKGKGYKIYTL